jgi:hypothetical protein
MAGPSHDQKRWIDKKTIALEDRFPEIVAWIEKDCRYWHGLRSKQAKEQKVRVMQLLEQREHEKALENERDKFEQPVQDAENWKRANLIREYIDALEDSIKTDETMSGEQREYIQ